jgi:hypothetical protein
MRIFAPRVISCLVVSIVVVGSALAGDAVKSGLKPGESVTEFPVHDVTGPYQGRTVCYRCRYRDSAVVCVFARKTSESLASLVKQLDAKINETRKFNGFVVLTTKQGENPSGQLKKLAADAGIVSVPLTFWEGADGPPAYQLSNDAEFTVLMWRGGTVRANHAYKSELTEKDTQAILADIPKITAIEPPRPPG